VELVAALETVFIAVERVRVLHRELAGSKHPGAGPRLVALLGLDVVEDQRQVAVGANLARDVNGERLLVGHREDVGRPLAVLELEQLVDLVAPGAPPRLGGLEHGHQHLLTADRVDLLADDRLDLGDHPVAGRKPRPQPRPELADEPGADHQPVRDRLRIGRILAQGRQEVAGEPCHRAGLKISWR
jgi:hypothetical protein